MYSSKNNSNKKIKIIGMVSILLIIISAVIVVVLSLMTDIFKSDEEIFKQYFLQNLDAINGFTDISSEYEYRKILEENSFSENTVVGLKYISNEGREDNFTGNITGINNNESNLAYKDIKINSGDTNVINITYLNENDIYGIRFLNGTKFAVIDTANNITSVLKYFGVNDLMNTEKINNVKLSDLLILSKEEVETIEETYLTIILQKITKDNYSSQKEKVITLSNNQSVTTDSHILTISEEKLNEICESILKQLTTDEIILSKIENLDKKIKEMGINLKKDIKTLYIESINEKAKDLDVKSGVVITVYGLEGTTVRTTIEYENKVLEIDLNNINDIIFKYSDLVSESIQNTIISIKKENDVFQANYEGHDGRKFEYIRQLNMNESEIKSVTNIKCSDNEKIKELELSINRDIKTGEVNEIPTSFDQAGKVLLNDYDDQSTKKNLNDLRKRIVNSLRSKRDETNSQLLTYIIDYNNQLEENEKAEEENKRKRFNSKFELYEGEQLEKNIVFNMLDEAGKNMSNYQIVGGNQIKIYIEEGKQNKDLAEEIKSKLSVEEVAAMAFNIRIKYDSKAKVNEIIIELVQPVQGQ